MRARIIFGKFAVHSSIDTLSTNLGELIQNRDNLLGIDSIIKRLTQISLKMRDLFVRYLEYIFNICIHIIFFFFFFLKMKLR